MPVAKAPIRSALVTVGLGPTFATKTALALVGLFLLATSGAYGAPYCLLRKPFSPPQPNCFQFYLADTAVAPPSTMAVVGPTGCLVTAYAARQGWEPDPISPM